jgi:hypothetical protein
MNMCHCLCHVGHRFLGNHYAATVYIIHSEIFSVYCVPFITTGANIYVFHSCSQNHTCSLCKSIFPIQLNMLPLSYLSLLFFILHGSYSFLCYLHCLDYPRSDSKNRNLFSPTHPKTINSDFLLFFPISLSNTTAII